MDILYPIKFNRRGYPDLARSLRTIHNIKQFIGNVYCAGDSHPGFLKINHLCYPDWYGDKQKTVIHKLLRACRDSNISESFILMNDDFFILRQIDTLPWLTFETVGDYITRQREVNPNNKYIDAAVTTSRFVGTDAPSFSIHAPVILERKKVLELNDKYDLAQPLHFRTLYGNHYGVDYIKVPGDFKNTTSPKTFLSCDDSGATAAYAIVDKLYPSKSQFE